MIGAWEHYQLCDWMGGDLPFQPDEDAGAGNADRHLLARPVVAPSHTGDIARG